MNWTVSCKSDMILGHKKLYKILRDGDISPPYLPPEKSICMQVKKQQLELDMEQRTASKLGKQ